MSSIPLTPGLQRLLALVIEADPPMGSAEIADRMCRSQSHTTDRLRILRNRGLIAPTSHGKAAVWAATDKALAIRAANADGVQRDAARQRDRAAAAAAAERWASSSMVCRIVPAGSAPPPVRPPAPFSVFSLAAMSA